MSNVPVALREAAIERQRIRRGGDTNNDDNDYDDGTFNDNNKKGKDLWDKSNTESYLFDGMQQQQQEEEKRNYRIQLQNLPYTRLYQAWVQECRAPELLPYPYEMIQQIRDGMMRYENYTTMNEQQEDQGEGGDRHRHRRHTNENLNAVMDSLLRIDAERVKFLLSDLLKRRIQKITLHPQYYTNVLLNDPKQQQQQQQQDEGDESNENDDNKEDHPLMCRPEVSGKNCVSHIFGGMNHYSNSLIFFFCTGKLLDDIVAKLYENYETTFIHLCDRPFPSRCLADTRYTERFRSRTKSTESICFYTMHRKCHHTGWKSDERRGFGTTGR